MEHDVPIYDRPIPEVADHPLFSGEYPIGLMAGGNPATTPAVPGGDDALRQLLRQQGLKFEETDGSYGAPEHSFIVHGPTREQMYHLGKVLGQESIVYSNRGKHELLYTNGPNDTQAHPGHSHYGFHPTQPPADYYTKIPGKGYLRLYFNQDQLNRVPLRHSSEIVPPPAPPQNDNASGDDVKQGLAKALRKALQISGQLPMKWAGAHPWHEVHPAHHFKSSSCAVIVPANYFQDQLRKDEAPRLQHPHTAAHGKATDFSGGAAQNGNAQAAVVGSSKAYGRFAAPYGTVNPQKPTSLKFYPLEGMHEAAKAQMAHHGYQSYYAGGAHGRPDLVNKNYGTGHLMIYDPSEGSGGDFGSQSYTDAWRHTHELAHALTYGHLNSMYGEGRRIGALGKQRTLREAKRAVHWEWLAAHKQRELAASLGVHIPDEDFHRELNTVMHDAVHRAVTGKFTEPGAEGFQPHPHKVPLETALGMVDEAGKQMGLTNENELRKMQKSDTDQSHFLKPEYREHGYSLHYHPDRGAELFQTGAGRVVHAFYNPKIGAVETRGFPNHHKWVGASTIKAMEDLVMAHARPDLTPGLQKSLHGICPDAHRPNLIDTGAEKSMSEDQNATRQDVIAGLKKSLLAAVAKREAAITAVADGEARGQAQLNKAEQKPEDKRECPSCHAKVGASKEGALKPHGNCKAGGTERGVVKGEMPADGGKPHIKFGKDEIPESGGGANSDAMAPSGSLSMAEKPTSAAAANEEIKGFKSLASNPTAMPGNVKGKPFSKADMSDPSLCKAFGCGADMHKCGDIMPGKSMKKDEIKPVGVVEEKKESGAKLPDGPGKSIKAEGSGDVTKETTGPDVKKGKKLSKGDTWNPETGKADQLRDKSTAAAAAPKKSPAGVRGTPEAAVKSPGLRKDDLGATPRTAHKIKLPGLTPALPKGIAPGTHADVQASLGEVKALRGVKAAGAPAPAVLGGPAARPTGTPPPIPAAARKPMVKADPTATTTDPFDVQAGRPIRHMTTPQKASMAVTLPAAAMMSVMPGMNAKPHPAFPVQPLVGESAPAPIRLPMQAPAGSPPIAMQKAAIPSAPKPPAAPAAPKPPTKAAPATTSIPTFKNKGAAPPSATAPGKTKP
jgi:hypothetical protein